MSSDQDRIGALIQHSRQFLLPTVISTRYFFKPLSSPARQSQTADCKMYQLRTYNRYVPRVRVLRARFKFAIAPIIARARKVSQCRVRLAVFLKRAPSPSLPLHPDHEASEFTRYTGASWIRGKARREDQKKQVRGWLSGGGTRR